MNCIGKRPDLKMSNSRLSLQSATKDGENKPKFLAVTRLEDVQAIRCAEFHPSGQFYAVGSNSKTLRICAYPKLNDLRYGINKLFKTFRLIHTSVERKGNF